jgi:hypothetical protein
VQGRHRPVFGDLPSPAWMEAEISWMQDPAGLFDGVMPLKSPEKALDWLESLGKKPWGPWELNFSPPLYSPTEDLAAAYLSPKQDAPVGRSWDVDSLQIMAGICRNDIGDQFFREFLVLHASKLHKAKGIVAFARNSGLLAELDQLSSVHRVAMDQAFLHKYAHVLARPEEVFARMGLPLTMFYNDGAPRHPAFVSGHAACAGAGAAVLQHCLDLSPEENDLLISLAELTFIGRWTAGIHWMCDGIAGLRGGYEIARDMLSLDTPNPWEPQFQAMQAL